MHESDIIEMPGHRILAGTGKGILGAQFQEPGQEQPLGFDWRQWVRDLEWREHVPDDLDRRRAEQRMSFDPQHGVVGLRHAGRLVWWESEPRCDRAPIGRS